VTRRARVWGELARRAESGFAARSPSRGAGTPWGSRSSSLLSKTGFVPGRRPDTL
jgi:hypothetical protein